ncbi:hypothetical protein ACN2C3_03635 [Aliarcobacter butzleri]
MYQDGDSVANVGKEQKFQFVFDSNQQTTLLLDLKYSHKDLFEKGANLLRTNAILKIKYSPDL